MNARQWPKTCDVCGTDFIGRTPNVKRCSSACRAFVHAETERLAKRPRKVVPRDEGPCAGCSLPIPHSRNRNAKYCSKPCAARAQNVARTQRRREARGTLRCKNCNIVFDPKGTSALNCSPECRRSSQIAGGKVRYRSNHQHHLDYARQWRRENKQYLLAYNKKYRAENAEYFKEFGKKHRANNPEYYKHRSDMRRAALAGAAFGTPFTWIEIMERDKWTCHLCEKPIRQKRWQQDNPHDRWLGHVDHVIPLSRGGSHGAEFVKAAHAHCNQSKHAQLMEELSLPMAGPSAEELIAIRSGELVAA